MAYLRVQSLAISTYLVWLVLNMRAMSGTSGSSGFGSVRRELIESRTFDTVSAGDHVSLRMSRQIEPFALMLGWKMRVVKLILGGLNG